MVQHSKDSNGKGTERADHKRAHHGIHHSRPFYGYPRITVALKKEGNRYYLYCLRTTILLSFCSTR
ncbi:hypothetical protein, partial [Bacillus subtilis]